MHDVLELSHGRGIVHHACRQFGAVNLAVRRSAGEGGLDRRRRLALVELVHGGIGVVDGHARFRKQFRGGGFPHFD